MKTLSIFILCIIGMLSAQSAFAAKIYKWVDDNGVVNFSEHPPKNTKASIVRPNIGHSEPVHYEVPAPENNTPATTAQPSLKDDKRCEISRKNMQTLQDFGRVRVPNEDGSFHYLTDAERQERLKITAQAIEESC